PQDHSGDASDVIKQMFNPEFRNRLTAIIHFKPLDLPTIKNVVDKFLVELQTQLDGKKVVIDVDEAARNWLAEHGYDKIMGARPMERLIKDKIKKPLAEELLFGKLEHGGNVAIMMADNDIRIEITTRAEETAEGAA
ncbi:MAG: ATP-dependent Clp protease ATP-binding subunit ClpA, partial [Gammaproteobacteria bacterium]